MPLPGLVRVRGRSMEPTLRDGDLLLVVWRLGARRTPARELLLVALPRDDAGHARPLAVKRHTGPDDEDPDRIWVEGDNPGAGVDSWTVGTLPRSAVRARVITRLPRRGTRVRRMAGG